MEIKQLFLKSGYRPFVLVFVVDDSGSMDGLELKVCDGFNKLIDGLRKHPLYADSYVVVRSLHGLVEMSGPLETLPRMSYDATGGSTPLYDSIGDNLTELDAYQEVVEDRGYKYRGFFGVLTDGGDNSSKRFTRNWTIQEIKRRREQGLTAFIGIDLGGVNQDFYEEAGFKIIEDSRDMEMMFQEVQEYLEEQVVGLLTTGSPSVIAV